MRLKILNSQKEKEINKELEKMEKDRNVDNIFPFKNKTCIISYADNKELKEELESIKNKLEELRCHNLI